MDIYYDGRRAENNGPGSQAQALMARERVHNGINDNVVSNNADLTTNRMAPSFNNLFLKPSEVCNVLHACLPSQEDVNILFGTGRAVIFVQAICNHYGELFHEGDFRPNSTLATLPVITAHPVIIARKLLQLALCIQQLDPSFDRGSDAMETYFTVATSRVTCHDELLDSIEGLECLVYEGVFLVNAENLRRALVCLRRASTLAQFMGLHRKNLYKPLKQHDQATHVSGTVIWAHIAYLERYLSLLLGMPTAISRVRFASDEIQVGDTSADWFEKMQTDIFERMIERNQERDYHDLTTTQRIDNDLNRMANQIPAKWWAPMDLTQSMDIKDMMEKVISA